MPITSLTASWLPAATEAINAVTQRADMTTDRLRRLTLDDPTAAAELLLLAVEGQRVEGFCLGCQREQAGAVKLLGVRPASRRQGLASGLLAQFETACRQLGLEQIVFGAVAPNYYLPGVPVDCISLIAALDRWGYHSDRLARVNMTVDLKQSALATEDDVARLRSEGLLVQRATPDQVEQASAWAGEHFSPAWAWEVSQTATYQPVPLFVALDGDTVVGFAVYDVTGHAWFGPTGTLPAQRRRGIGGCLLRLCLADMRARGDSLAEIGWAGPLGYYARAVGAQMGRAFWVFAKELEPEPRLP